VATTELPDRRFYWWLTLLKLQAAGFIIDNNRLQLDDWVQLGELKQAVQQQKDSQNLIAMANTLSIGVTRGLHK